MNSAMRRQFLTEYAAIRHAEGRGSSDSRYYQNLPDQDLSGANQDQWRIRARSFHHFESRILNRLEKDVGRPLDVLDLGAGNGWMSHRLALRGHRVTALDIFPDERDGLGALVHYPIAIPATAAEFDHLPFRDSSFDVAIYNASFHYSPDYRRTLQEARRCLRAPGKVVVMDSPIYQRFEHGEMMRSERRRFFQQQYGFPSDALGSVEFLDRTMLAQLALELQMDWEETEPWYGLQWALRPWKARFRGKRPPSRFIILVGSFRRP